MLPICALASTNAPQGDGLSPPDAGPPPSGGPPDAPNDSPSYRGRKSRRNVTFSPHETEPSPASPPYNPRPVPPPSPPAPPTDAPMKTGGEMDHSLRTLTLSRPARPRWPIPGRVELVTFAVLALILAAAATTSGDAAASLGLLAFPLFISAALLGMHHAGRLAPPSPSAPASPAAPDDAPNRAPDER